MGDKPKQHIWKCPSCNDGIRAPGKVRKDGRTTLVPGLQQRSRLSGRACLHDSQDQTEGSILRMVCPQRLGGTPPHQGRVGDRLRQKGSDQEKNQKDSRGAKESPPNCEKSRKAKAEW